MGRHPTDSRSHHAESDRHSTTTTGLHEATGPSGFIFAPLWDNIGRAVWTTEVDRILVLSAEVNGTAPIWLRLIGPGNALNLKPSTKVTRQSIVTLEVDTEAVPQSHHDLAEYRIGARGCLFADAYVYIYQHGLDEWSSTNPNELLQYAEVVTWTLVILYDLTGAIFDRSPDSKFSRAWVRKKLLPW